MTARVLAIDLSGPGGGAALLLPDRLLRETIAPGVPRGRDLVPSVQRMLQDAGLGVGDLDGIACGVGPGSFTGIRIAVATVATLAWTAGRAVLGVGSLDGIAANAPESARAVLVALDARRGRVFRGRFVREDAVLRADGPYRNVDPADAIEGLPDDAFVLGDARAKHADTFERFAGTADAPVRPDVIARIAADRFARGERLAPDRLRPLYLRLSDPEIRRGL